MGFDDLFENRNKHYGNYSRQSHHDDKGYSHDSYRSYYGQGDHIRLLTILRKIWSNKRLKVFVLITGILVLIIITVLIIFLVPVIIKLIHYISENGLKGLLDGITGFLDKIWKGSGE